MDQIDTDHDIDQFRSAGNMVLGQSALAGSILRLGQSALAGSILDLGLSALAGSILSIHRAIVAKKLR